MRIAISGITGHIGNNLGKLLIQKGYEIKALLRNNKYDFVIDEKIERITGEINDPVALDLLCKDTEVLIHLAAKISIYPKDRELIFKTNIEGVKNVIDACLKNGVKKIIHFSSIHAHNSNGMNNSINEKTPYVSSDNMAYDFSKSQGEQLMLKAREKGINVCIINPTAVIGPNDFLPSFSGKMLMDIYTGRLPMIVKGGFDWVDVRDICNAVLNILEKNITNEKFILSGHYASIKQIAEHTCSVKGKNYNGIALPIWLAKIGVPFIAIYAKLSNTLPLYTSASLTALEEGSDLVEHKNATKLLAYDPRPLDESISDAVLWSKQYFSL